MGRPELRARLREAWRWATSVTLVSTTDPLALYLGEVWTVTGRGGKLQLERENAEREMPLPKSRNLLMPQTQLMRHQSDASCTYFSTIHGKTVRTYRLCCRPGVELSARVRLR